MRLENDLIPRGAKRPHIRNAPPKTQSASVAACGISYSINHVGADLLRLHVTSLCVRSRC